MLHDRTRGELELAQDPARGVEIAEVVEGKLLARELLRAREKVTAGSGLRVIGRPLVWILPVWEVALLLERENEPGGECLAVGEPGRDRGLVGRRVPKRFGRKLAMRLGRELAVQPEFLEYRPVPLD